MLPAKQPTKEKLTSNIASNNLIALRITPNLDTMRAIILYFKICARLIMGFIKVRLNRDNFRNLMFLAVTALGIMLSEWLSSIPNLNLLGLVTLIISLTFVPWLMIFLNRVCWIEDSKIFVSKQGRVINTKPLKLSLLVFPAIAGSTVVVPDFLETLFSSNTLDRFIITLVFVSFFIAPVLFFILINCPISILFNKNCYRFSAGGVKFEQSNVKRHQSLTSSSTLSDSITTSPRYAHFSCNVYYHQRHHNYNRHRHH